MLPVAFCAPQHRRAIEQAAILASSMGCIHSSVTAIALPAMLHPLLASLAQAQWFSAACQLTLSALILAGGALGDRFCTPNWAGGWCSR